MKILPITVLQFLVTSNNSVTIFYNELSDIIQCQLLILYLGLTSTIDTRRYYLYLR